VLASAWFPPRRFAMFSGLAMGIGLLGGIAGQAPLALAVENLGWRETKMTLGALALGLAVVMWLLVRDAPSPRAPRAAATGGENVLRGLWKVVRHSQTLYIAAFAGLMSSTMLAFGALWGVPYTMQAYGLSKVEAASTMAPILFGFTAGAPSWGWLSDRIGRRKLPMLAGAATGVASTAAALYIPGLPITIYSALLFFVGFGGGAMAVSYAAAREHTAGGGTGAALGFVNMVSVLGGAVFQPLIGWLLDLQWDGRLAGGARVYAAETFRNAFIVLPALYGLAFLFALRVRETFCRPYAAPAQGARVVAEA
jgi:MFS family permease